MEQIKLIREIALNCGIPVEYVDNTFEFVRYWQKDKAVIVVEITSEGQNFMIPKHGIIK